jgi:hypothetical protein
VLDTDGNGRLNAADKIGGVFASGVESKVGISPTPTIVTGSVGSGISSPGAQILGTTGQMQAGSGVLTAYAIGNPSFVGGPPPVNPIGLSNRAGRISWREVLRK